jgi:NADH dehydrogenase FAD-containing subunit
MPGEMHSKRKRTLKNCIIFRPDKGSCMAEHEKSHIVVLGGGFGGQEFAPGLKTLEDALRIRSRVLLAFEKAENTEDPAEREALLTIVIVGSGPTGVELAGA